MVQIWIVDIMLEDGTEFERPYVARSSYEALDKAERDYPMWLSLGARLEEGQ